MTVTISGFADSPDRGEGHARDFRVRWALEEVGQPYTMRLLPWKDFKSPEHRARHPFGKIPTYEDGGLTLFESGAIVLHIAERHPGLLPADADARGRATMWMFAALTTVEPPVVEHESAMIMERDKSWFAERQRMLDDRVRDTLRPLSDYLGGREWLDGSFSAGDLLMITVLRRLEFSNVDEGPDLLGEYPRIAAYVQRGKDRPAFERAFAAEREDFRRTHREQPDTSAQT